MSDLTLFDRLGGYSSIVALVDDLLPRLQSDTQLGRFWAHRGADGIARERQLLIDFLCSESGGPLYYRGRNMVLTHKGMNISGEDWCIFLRHAGASLEAVGVKEPELSEVVEFVTGLADEIIEEKILSRLT